MNNHVNLLAFGTFGHPNGYTQSFFIGNPDLSKKIKTFDMNTSALNLFPNTKVYAIRKDVVNENTSIAYSVYTYAREQNSTRGGTFIGSALLFINKIADENITISCLNEFHNKLENKNVKNDTFAIAHSKDFSVVKPKELDKMSAGLKEIQEIDPQTSSKNLVVYCETNPSKLQSLFQESIGLLNVYDTIYFTENAEVAEFVHHKNIFKLVKRDEFAAEIEEVKEAQKQKVLAVISEFQNELQLLENEQSKTLERFREKMLENEKLHRENELRIKQSKLDIEKISRNYINYAIKIKELVEHLKINGNLKAAKNNYTENKKRFLAELNQQDQRSSVNTITPAITGSKVFYTHAEYEETDNSRRRINRSERAGSGTYIFTTFLFLLLLIATWVYFLCFAPA